jgi:predicted transcriptional regulator
MRIAHRRAGWRPDVPRSAPHANGIAAARKGVSIIAIISGRTASA